MAGELRLLGYVCLRRLLEEYSELNISMIGKISKA